MSYNDSNTGYDPEARNISIEAEEDPFSKANRINNYGMEPVGVMQDHELSRIIQTIKDAEAVAVWHTDQGGRARNLANSLREVLAKASQTGISPDESRF